MPLMLSITFEFFSAVPLTLLAAAVTGRLITGVAVTAAGLTVTAQAAVKPPSLVVTVILAVPAAIADTRPLELTEAAFLLLVDHLTPGLVASGGATVAVSCKVDPAVMVAVVWFRVTPVTGTFLVTVIRSGVTFFLVFLAKTLDWASVP